MQSTTTTVIYIKKFIIYVTAMPKNGYVSLKEVSLQQFLGIQKLTFKKWVGIKEITIY